MRKKLVRNFGLKLASLVLAFVLWFLVVQINDPLDSVTFNNVEIDLVNTDLLEQEGKVYEVIDESNIARVTVLAPRSVIGQIRKSDIVAEADMSKLTDINTIAVNYYVENLAVDSVDGNRDIVRLNVEDRASKWIRLTSSVVGDVAEGHLVTNVSLDQTTIEISGPQSVVSEVAYAAVEMGVTGAVSNLSANVDIQLYDEEDQLIENNSIKKNVNSAYMQVEVLATKNVPVKIEYSGQPAEGYLATGVVESNKEYVAIAGRNAALEGISEIVIPGESLDITGATGTVYASVDLDDFLPDNIRWAEKGFGGKVAVSVFVEPVQRKSLEVPAANIKLINTPAELVVSLPEEVESYEVEISGLAKDVNAVDVQTLIGVVDIQGYFAEQEIDVVKAGVYEIPVAFEPFEGVTVETEVVVQVQIREPEIERRDV